MATQASSTVIHLTPRIGNSRGLPREVLRAIGVNAASPSSILEAAAAQATLELRLAEAALSECSLQGAGEHADEIRAVRELLEQFAYETGDPDRPGAGCVEAASARLQAVELEIERDGQSIFDEVASAAVYTLEAIRSRLALAQSLDAVTEEA